MNKLPLVYVCIPHYNNKKTISKTLDSLLMQTYSNIVIKVIDNASTDGSIDILRQYERKYQNIQVIKNKKNIGGEANFTKCIENLEGKYGAVYHADDIYHSDMIAKQVAFLESHAECSAVAVHSYTIDENSQRIGYRPFPPEYSHKLENIIGDQLELFQAILKNGNFITCPSVMARTDIYKQKIKFWRGEEFKTSADLDVWLRLANYGKFALLSEPLMSYRESTVSYSYKDVRTRTGENNMFLVLEHYLQKHKEKLSQEDLQRYEFLIFKDNVNRTINEIIQGKKGNLQLDLFSKNILYVALSNKINLKIYLTAFIVKVLRNFKLPENLRDTLFTLRFSKGKS